jgi:cytochrome P450
MTEMVGVPSSEREQFIKLASAHLEAITVTPGKDPEEVARIHKLAIWERLLARFSDWELTADPVTWSNPFLRGVTSLPISFQA